MKYLKSARQLRINHVYKLYISGGSIIAKYLGRERTVGCGYLNYTQSIYHHECYFKPYVWLMVDKQGKVSIAHLDMGQGCGWFDRELIAYA